MAQRITWKNPESKTVLKVEISRSPTPYGKYVIINEIRAKNESDWVTNYLDPEGTISDWYKIRFYDEYSNEYSEYSNRISGVPTQNLCSVGEVKGCLKDKNRWSDDEIFNIINQVENLLYIEYGDNISAFKAVCLNRVIDRLLNK